MTCKISVLRVLEFLIAEAQLRHVAPTEWASKAPGEPQEHVRLPAVIFQRNILSLSGSEPKIGSYGANELTSETALVVPFFLVSFLQTSSTEERQHDQRVRRIASLLADLQTFCQIFLGFDRVPSREVRESPIRRNTETDAVALPSLRRWRTLQDNTARFLPIDPGIDGSARARSTESAGGYAGQVVDRVR